MNKLILGCLLIIPLSASASWNNKSSYSVGYAEDIQTKSGAKSAALAKCNSAAASNGYDIYLCRLDKTSRHASGYWLATYTLRYWYDDGTDVTIPENSVVYGAPYTDEQCSEAYAGTYSVTFPQSASDTTYISAGACALYSVPDENGIGNLCSTPDDTTQSCYGDWEAISTGEVNVLDLDAGGQDTGGGVEQSDEVPEYLTSTDDPSSCSTGSVSFGGASYCVDNSTVTVTDMGGSPFGSGGSGDGDGDGSGDGDGDGSGDGEGDTDGQCDPETDGECDGESTECLPGMACYVPTDAQVEAKFFDYFPGSVDNTQVTEYDASDFELDGEYESGLTSGSCPAPVPVTLALGGNSHTFEITFEFFCQFALLIRGLVLASCSFLAANIIYRGVVTLV